MSTPVVRLLPFESTDGPANMAADEVMLDAAAAGIASLRFYAWRPATLSLGYFQPQAARLSDPLLASLPFVRRASGGATLVHHRELTYALALPAGAPWQRRSESWICRMHQVIALGLASFGVAAQTCPDDGEQKLGDVLCFQHQTPGDLIVQSHKIAGSAQRKQRGALLQHGGILLARSPHTPTLPGLKELTGANIAISDLSAAICREFEQDTGWHLQPSNWSPIERAQTQDLARTKYRSEDWNLKR